MARECATDEKGGDDLIRRKGWVAPRTVRGRWGAILSKKDQVELANMDRALHGLQYAGGTLGVKMHDLACNKATVGVGVLMEVWT
jgi:hypothetical protein